jgi:hypothetical protein
MDWLWRRLARTILEASELDAPSTRALPTEQPMMASDPLTPERVFHDAALKFLDQQVAINKELDDRTAQTFQVGSTVVTIAFGLLSLSQSTISDRSRWCLYGAFAAYGLVLIFCFVATRMRAFAYRPDIAAVRRYAQELSGDDLQLWVALEYHSSTEINQKRLRPKARVVGLATLFLYIEGICLAAAALLTLL